MKKSLGREHSFLKLRPVFRESTQQSKKLDISSSYVALWSLA
jgi:hypothetical protein